MLPVGTGYPDRRRMAGWTWREREGSVGLAEPLSLPPNFQSRQLDARVEALICSCVNIPAVGAWSFCLHRVAAQLSALFRARLVAACRMVLTRRYERAAAGGCGDRAVTGSGREPGMAVVKPHADIPDASQPHGSVTPATAADSGATVSRKGSASRAPNRALALR